MLYLNYFLFSKYLLIVERFGSLKERRYICVHYYFNYYYYYYYYYYYFIIVIMRIKYSDQQNMYGVRALEISSKKIKQKIKCK